MPQFHLTRKVQDFLLYIYEKGQITRKTQPFYTFSMSYYMMISYLKNLGLIVQNGFTENNEKIWVLSEKGKRVCSLLKKIRKLMEGENGR